MLPNLAEVLSSTENVVAASYNDIDLGSGIAHLKLDIENSLLKLVEVEDIYRPFKEKKKTKATEAINNGLEPLAKMFMKFPKDMPKITEFLNDKVKTEEDAITGAKYIIAENKRK